MNIFALRKKLRREWSAFNPYIKISPGNFVRFHRCFITIFPVRNTSLDRIITILEGRRGSIRENDIGCYSKMVLVESKNCLFKHLLIIFFSFPICFWITFFKSTIIVQNWIFPVQDSLETIEFGRFLCKWSGRNGGGGKSRKKPQKPKISLMQYNVSARSLHIARLENVQRIRVLPPNILHMLTVNSQATWNWYLLQCSLQCRPPYVMTII